MGNFKEDARNIGYNTTIAEFVSLTDENGFLNFCKTKKIFANKRKDTNQPQEESRQNSAPKVQLASNPQPKSNPKIANPSFCFYKDEAYGKGIEDFIFDEKSTKFFEIDNTQAFKLKTTYPGLLVGSGYNHPKLKSNDDDFQLGFFFDHTTGLPIISGSSIKGVLRSVAKQKEFMQSEYGQILSEEIFEDGKTIFYDAFISKADKKGKIFGSDYITSHFSNEPMGALKNPNPIKFLKVLPNVEFKFQFKADKN
ncbi:MAG: hypothetical protein RL154_815, partial [Pseudomonadota bacterium]